MAGRDVGAARLLIGSVTGCLEGNELNVDDFLIDDRERERDSDGDGASLAWWNNPCSRFPS